MNQAQQFIKILQSSGFSLKLIATRVGVTQVHISYILHGKRGASKKLTAALQRMLIASGNEAPPIQQEPGNKPYTPMPDKAPHIIREEIQEPDIPPMVEEQIAQYGNYSLTRTVPSTQAHERKQVASSRRRSKPIVPQKSKARRNRRKNKPTSPSTSLTVARTIIGLPVPQQPLSSQSQAQAIANAIIAKKYKPTTGTLSIVNTPQPVQAIQISRIEQETRNPYYNIPNKYNPTVPLYEYQEPEVQLGYRKSERYIDR